MAMTTTTAIESDLRLITFLSDVQKESLPDEIFDKNEGEFMVANGESKNAIPDDIYMRLDALADGTNKVQVPLLKALSGAATYGGQTQEGREETLDYQYFTMYSNDVSHAVVHPNYGTKADDYLPYLKDKEGTMSKLLGTYFKEIKGMHRRQALLEVHSYNLTADGVVATSGHGTNQDAAWGFTPYSTSGGLVATMQWHPNWFLPKITDAQQPSYSETDATWNERLGDALNSMGTAADAAGDVVFLQRLEEYARDQLFIDMVDIGEGLMGYVLVLPSPTARYLKNPTDGLPTLGNLYTAADGLPKETIMKFPGALGRVGCLLLVEDPRFATITTGGADGAWTITPKYRAAGRGTNSDPRDRSSTTRYYIGNLIGARALCEWVADDFHFEYNYSAYDREVGMALVTRYGIQAPVYDGDGATARNLGSIVVPFAPPPAA